MKIDARVRTGAVVVIAAAVIVAAGVWLNNVIPFNFEYVLQINAHRIRNDVKDWSLRSKPANYAHTNSAGRSYLFRTNVTVNGRGYETVMRLDCILFRNNGSLVADDSNNVFWMETSGKVEMLKSRSSGK